MSSRCLIKGSCSVFGGTRFDTQQVALQRSSRSSTYCSWRQASILLPVSLATDILLRPYSTCAFADPIFKIAPRMSLMTRYIGMYLPSESENFLKKCSSCSSFALNSRSTSFSQNNRQRFLSLRSIWTLPRISWSTRRLTASCIGISQSLSWYFSIAMRMSTSKNQYRFKYAVAVLSSFFICISRTNNLRSYLSIMLGFKSTSLTTCSFSQIALAKHMAVQPSLKLALQGLIAATAADRGMAASLASLSLL